jgi:large subunit ribosomal protein L1
MGKNRKQIVGLADIDKQHTEEKAEKTVVEAAVEVKKEEKAPKKNISKKVRGKKYLEAKKKMGEKKVMKLTEAVELLKKAKYASFDESVDLHMNVVKTGLRGEVELPHSTGKVVRVAIVNDTVLEELAQGKIEFDVLITHPSFMSKLARFAKVLGPKGLMPNPKAGTVSATPEEVAKKFMKGTLRWKTEPKFPIIHQMVGKLSYDSKNLVENAQAFIDAVGKTQIKSVFITSSMGLSVGIEIEEVV